MNKVISLITLVAALFAAPVANAALQYQQDTNSLVPFTTNTFALYGDNSGSFTNGGVATGNSFLDGQKADDLWIAVGAFVTNTASASSNITFRIAQTCDFANWTNSAQVLTLVVPALTTNWAVNHTLIQNAAPGYGLRAIENIHGAAVSLRIGTAYVKAVNKNGI